MGTVDVLVMSCACDRFVLAAHVSPPGRSDFLPLVSQVLNGVTVGLGSGRLVCVFVLL